MKQEKQFTLYLPINIDVTDSSRVGGKRTDHLFDLQVSGYASLEDGEVTYIIHNVHSRNKNGRYDITDVITWLAGGPSEVDVIHEAAQRFSESLFKTDTNE